VNEIQKDYREQDEQLGFRENSSCAHAIFVVKQMIKLYSERNNKCIVCALDASKAFDKVVRSKLWLKLLNAGVRACIVLILIEYYNNSWMVVVNGSNKSNYFTTTNGVKQGGVVSPKLYNAYGAELIKVIKQIQMGVKLKNKYVSIVVYADDVLLISSDEK